MTDTPRRKCARCGNHPAMRDSEFCRWHGGLRDVLRKRTPPEDVGTPPDGIRLTYEVTFTPAEVARVRAAASEARTTVSGYLHDLVVREATPTQIVVHVENSALDMAALAREVEASFRRRGPHGRA